MSKEEQALALYIAIAELNMNEEDHRAAEELAEATDPEYQLPVFNHRPRRKKPTH